MPYANEDDDKEWRRQNKKHLNQYKNNWTKNNRDKVNNRRHEREEKDPERKKSANRKYNSSLKGRYNTAKGRAKWREKTFNLSFEQFCELISKPCFYCNNELGDKCITGAGLDRIDNSVGYELGNVCSCCKYCNQIKGEILSAEETKAAVAAILEVRKKWLFAMYEASVMIFVLAVWRVNWAALQSLLVNYSGSTATMAVATTLSALFHTREIMAPITKKWVPTSATTTTPVAPTSKSKW